MPRALWQGAPGSNSSIEEAHHWTDANVYDLQLVHLLFHTMPAFCLLELGFLHILCLKQLALLAFFWLPKVPCLPANQAVVFQITMTGVAIEVLPSALFPCSTKNKCCASRLNRSRQAHYTHKARPETGLIKNVLSPK